MKKWWFTLVALVFATVLYLASRPSRLTSPSADPMWQTYSSGPQASKPTIAEPPPGLAASTPPATIGPAPIRKGQRAFYGELPPGVSDLKDLVMINRPSKDWPSKLRGILTKTGGDQLKELDVEPQESYIIMDGVEGRHVERVVVTVKNKDGRMTRFFAEVDSESGHVTKTWGATLHEAKHSH